MLAILFSIAEGLEHHAVTRTRRGLRALLSLVPPRATVIRHGREITISPEDLMVGDVMVLRPGERAATDGTITSGRTSLDLSASPKPTHCGSQRHWRPGANIHSHKRSWLRPGTRSPPTA